MKLPNYLFKVTKPAQVSILPIALWCTASAMQFSVHYLRIYIHMTCVLDSLRDQSPSKIMYRILKSILNCMDVLISNHWNSWDLLNNLHVAFERHQFPANWSSLWKTIEFQMERFHDFEAGVYEILESDWPLGIHSDMFYKHVYKSVLYFWFMCIYR